MKRKAVQIVLSLTLTAAMCFGAPAMAFAGETTAKEESTDKTEAKDSTEEKEEAKDFQIGDLTVKNQSGLVVKSAELQEAKEDDSKEKDSSDSTAEKDSTEESGQDLVITLKDGTERTFKNVTPDKWTDPVFIMSTRSFISVIQMKKEKHRKLQRMQKKENWKKL